MLYNFHYSGTSFNRIAYAIDGYDGPTVIMIKHSEDKKDFLFGAFKQGKVL